MVCGFDSNLERFAAVSADNRLKVWEVATGQLRHHFAQPTHLSSTYTCLSWGQSAADAIAGSKKKRGKSRELIALGTAQGDVVCWDLAKGEIVQSMRTKDEGEGGRRVHDVCFDSKCAALFSCGEGSHILQWAVVDAASASASQHKAVRRFKAEKRGVYKLALSNDDSLLIGAGRAHIKVWELASGRTVCKFPSHASATASLALSAPLPALFGANPALLLSSAAHDRLVNVWPIGHAVSHADVSELEISAPLLGLPCPAAPFVVSVNLHRSTDVVASSTAAASKRGKKRKHGESDAVTASDDASSNTDAADGAMHQFHILAVQTNQVSVFEVHSSGKLTAEPSSSAKGTSTTTSVHSQLTLPRTSDGSPFLYAGFKGASELLVVRGSLAKPHFQTLVRYHCVTASLHSRDSHDDMVRTEIHFSCGFTREIRVALTTTIELADRVIGDRTHHYTTSLAVCLADWLYCDLQHTLNQSLTHSLSLVERLAEIQIHQHHQHERRLEQQHHDASDGFDWSHGPSCQEHRRHQEQAHGCRASEPQVVRRAARGSRHQRPDERQGRQQHVSGRGGAPGTRDGLAAGGAGAGAQDQRLAVDRVVSRHPQPQGH